MKKIASLLTFVLVLALAVPAFAAEDNVEITGTVDTVFETADYGDNPGATASVLADEDVLDPDDSTDFPARKAFYQEIGFNIAGSVNENINFDLALDTLTNVFAETHDVDGINTPGTTEGSNKLKMDTALLTIGANGNTLKAGDLDGTHVEDYFIDDKDMDGVEVNTAVVGTDVKAFVLGTGDADTEDYYGVTGTKDLGVAELTGKLYQLRADDNITNVAISAKAPVTDIVTVDGEYVANSAEEADTNDNLIKLGAEATLTDALTVNGNVVTIGEDFEKVEDDVEDTNTTDVELGADYALNANNTVSGAYTLVTKDEDNTEDKSTVEASLENTMGAFTNTASVETTTNEEFTKDHNVTLVKLGTEYAMTDATTVTADLTNKTEEEANGDELSYNYLKAGVDTEVSENVTWNTEAQYVTGNTEDDTDATANSLTTSLDVSF